ncbi:AzlD domain-containing protein [Pallidibacillus pasinlerensis]|uniref:AzlD domain-containing protein n=1 Tax=Pallidibacillus pasinlerensis TaxID=2703818 RepID=A0ABX0AAD4_9BACI|nr:AzlD domain-containing protein [Pallidibacillus pasinlerensis]NCU18067.1 AzlD domain-containing protein [Pallidibacillus pasinlerensis]
MNSIKIYLYIFVMAAVTYLIRVLPLTLIRKKIENQFIKSFLHYVPYVTLAVMILDATGSTWSTLIGFIVALLLSYFGGNLFQVAIFACLSVFIVELFVY